MTIHNFTSADLPQFVSSWTFKLPSSENHITLKQLRQSNKLFKYEITDHIGQIYDKSHKDFKYAPPVEYRSDAFLTDTQYETQDQALEVINYILNNNII